MNSIQNDATNVFRHHHRSRFLTTAEILNLQRFSILKRKIRARRIRHSSMILKMFVDGVEITPELTRATDAKGTAAVSLISLVQKKQFPLKIQRIFWKVKDPHYIAQTTLANLRNLRRQCLLD